MRREISSSITNLYKVMLILIFAGFISANLYGILFDPDSVQILFTSVLMLLGYFIIRWAWNWKTVELTDKGFIISTTNFTAEKEVFVPFDQVEIVKQNFLLRGTPEFISIKLTAPTSLGNKIWFIPKTRFFSATSSHPIVEEMNRLVDKSKGFLN